MTERLAMDSTYSYNWHIQSFEQAKTSAETLILSVEEARFCQRPAPERWSAAECFHHLVKFGNIYFENLDEIPPEKQKNTTDVTGAFPPRWIWKKVANFFEPPYSFKISTFSSMEPGEMSDYNRMELLDEYINLQNRFIDWLQQAKDRQIDLVDSKIPHPIIGFLKLSLTEYYLLLAAHQRRHRWQAEQVLSHISQK